MAIVMNIERPTSYAARCDIPQHVGAPVTKEFRTINKLCWLMKIALTMGGPHYCTTKFTPNLTPCRLRRI